jgi:DNA-binding IclR family transcriptional regulator
MASLLDRHFDLLELLVEEPDGLPLTLIAARLEMPKSAINGTLL